MIDEVRRTGGERGSETCGGGEEERRAERDEGRRGGRERRAHRGVLQRLHFSRKAKLIFAQLGHFQSPGVLPGELPPGGIGGFTK